MRRYRRLLATIALIAAFAWFFVPALLTQTQSWLKHMQAIDTPALSATIDSSLAYPVKQKQWLKFALPKGDPQLRIVTNAHIQQAGEDVQKTDWAYALRYELLNQAGKPVKTGLYHQHSHLTVYKDSQFRQSYANYYLDRNRLPLDGRLILLDLQGIEDIAFLRVSLESFDPDITETAVRVYVPIKTSDHELATLWLRMSQAQKDKLAKNTIYPSSLLSAEEKSNLLKHQWQPIGPLGIEGKDYKALTLYTVKDGLEDNQTELMQASGLQADTEHYGVIPIEELGGKIDLTFKALDGSSLTSPVSVDLQWFGRDIEQRRQQTFTLTRDADSLSEKVDGGLLLIRPSSPVVINGYLTNPTKTKHDITDSLLSIKTYVSSFGVDFGVLHYRQAPTALRIDVRRLLTGPGHSMHEPVRYQWLNDQQHVIGSGELAALDQPSLFDRAGSIIDLENVSDPLSYYFNLPEEVTRLRLVSNDPNLLINAYNQPYDFVKYQGVPEYAYAPEDTQALQLSWFPLRALNDDSLIKQLAVRWLSAQYRPPEDNDELLAGQYLWQDYLPEGDVSARYLLSDYSGEQVRVEALASVYCRLPVNRDTQVTLSALGGLHNISPELIFIRDNTAPFSAELLLNRNKAAAIQSIGRIGIIPFPVTTTGTKRIRLNTDSGGRWLMNYQAQCDGEQYLKRRVFALNSKTALNFMVDHAPENETFSVRLYSPNNTAERSHVKVNIEALTSNAATAALSSEWTYKNRLYDIRPLATRAMPVLYSQGQRLSNGERFSIPLNSDLPPGRYRIRIALTKGPGGFVTLSQIKAGTYQQHRFYRENAFEP